MLDIREALSLLNSGNWCSIDYVNYDAKKQKFGEIVRIPKCRVMRSTGPSSDAPTTQNASISVNPNHSEHFTKNVTLPNGQVRKLHIRLLFAINNQRVL